MQRNDRNFWQWSVGLVACFWIAGSVAWLFHNLRTNPHTDMQLVTYTMQLLQSVQDGSVWDYLMTPRKYPLFPSLALGVLYGMLGGGLLMTGIVESAGALGPYFFAEREMLYLISRLFILAMSIGSVVLVYRIAAMLHGEKKFGFSAVVLLGSSVMFPVFSTAIRPHMPVTFMTLLTLYWSIRLMGKKSLKNELRAFGSAALAFCTLQNGLLAFLFPIFASGRRRIKQILFFGFSAGLFSLVFGYPFLLRTIAGGAKLGALGNTYFDGSELTGESMKAVGMLMLGSELFLTMFAIGGLLFIWKGHYKGHMVRSSDSKIAASFFIPIVGYLLLTILFFGLQNGSVMRFFFPVVPLLAIVGAPALVHASRTIQLLLVAVVILIQIKFAFLGVQPDTFQLTHDALMRYPNARIATHLPYYFLDIPSTLPLDAYRRAEIVVVRAGFEPKNLTGFEPCGQFGATPSSLDGLLWSDSDRDWLLWRLLTIRHLGPTISVYCKEHRLPFPAGED